MNIPKKNNIILILCTTSNIKNAKKITKILLKKKLISCANIIENIQSYYLWNKKIKKEKEIKIIIKTFSILKKIVYKIIKKYHNYDIPEILVIKTKNYNNKYSNWMNKEIKI